MTLIYVGPHGARNARNVEGPARGGLSRPGSRSVRQHPSYRAGQSRSDRPGPSRPGVAPMHYRGTGVARSTVAHRRRPVSVATTLGLALVAGVITLWLGLMANFGSMANGDSSEPVAQVPAALAVVRVAPGESLQELAARVAPGAPVRDVVERIRDLNALDSSAVSAGQTLIAPIG